MFETHFNLRGQSHALKLLVSRYVLLASLIRAVTILSDTFLIIYVIDQVGYSEAGLLVSIWLVTQALTDYPSGILSDRLGQRWVLTISFLSYSGAYYYFSVANGFTDLMIAYLLFAMASAQESGALDTWFDNNYKVLAKDDKREIYKGIRAKFRTIVDLAAAAMLILGGYLATAIGRKFVFQIQIIGLMILLGITVVLVKDSPGARDDANYNYGVLFKDGISSVFKSKLLGLLVLAHVLYYSTLGVFGTMIMFPGYFGYAGSDYGASIFRFTLFIGGSVLLWILADWFRGINARKWLGPTTIGHAILFFGSAGLVLTWIPIENQFNLLGILLFGSVIMIGHMIRVSIDILLQSIYVDIIPNHRRNGFYSLLPTLSLFVTSPLMFLAGIVIDSFGHVSVILGLLLLSLGSGLVYWKASAYIQDQTSNEVNS